MGDSSLSFAKSLAAAFATGSNADTKGLGTSPWLIRYFCREAGNVMAAVLLLSTKNPVILLTGFCGFINSSRGLLTTMLIFWVALPLSSKVRLVLISMRPLPVLANTTSVGASPLASGTPAMSVTILSFCIERVFKSKSGFFKVNWVNPGRVSSTALSFGKSLILSTPTCLKKASNWRNLPEKNDISEGAGATSKAPIGFWTIKFLPLNATGVKAGSEGFTISGVTWFFGGLIMLVVTFCI